MSAPDLHSQRGSRLADRLAAARRFVGRVSELELFRSALTAESPPFAVLHIHGPGGVGKTALLREYARLAEEAVLPVVLLDGRNLDVSPPGFILALNLALGLGETDSPLDALAQSTRCVLLLDTYEMLNPLDGWLRETFLPQLPAQALVVIAGRNPPEPAWRSDSDWRDLIQIVSLRNLRTEESQAYLVQRGVPRAQHSAVLGFTHGHPLALSLVADVAAQGGDMTFSPDQAPDVVAMLLERFVQDVPDS